MSSFDQVQAVGEEGANNIQDNVKEYYGKTLKTSDDLKTSVCTIAVSKMKKHVSDAMKLVHDEVVSKYFGCGLVVPECLEGTKILDLGSGSGRDCYALAKLVGQNGFVTGIDMTDEQLVTANKFIEYHREVFGYKKSNVKFVKGFIENLKDAGIEDNSVDIIISNCVINLCKDKKSVLQEAFHVLKDGGELYFSDMYADRVPSAEIRSHKVLWGEGFGGALYWKELFSLAKEIGFETPRTISAKVVEATNPEIKQLIGDARYLSVEYRLFKLPADANREAAEVSYNGNITGYMDELQFDYGLKFQKNKAVPVDGDTAAILRSSRFKDEFEFERATHGTNASKVDAIDPFDIAVPAAKSSSDVDCCPA